MTLTYNVLENMLETNISSFSHSASDSRDRNHHLKQTNLIVCKMIFNLAKSECLSCRLVKI